MIGIQNSKANLPGLQCHYTWSYPELQKVLGRSAAGGGCELFPGAAPAGPLPKHPTAVENKEDIKAKSDLEVGGMNEDKIANTSDSQHNNNKRARANQKQTLSSERPSIHEEARQRERQIGT